MSAVVSEIEIQTALLHNIGFLAVTRKAIGWCWLRETVCASFTSIHFYITWFGFTTIQDNSNNTFRKRSKCQCFIFMWTSQLQNPRRWLSHANVNFLVECLCVKCQWIEMSIVTVREIMCICLYIRRNKKMLVQLLWLLSNDEWRLIEYATHLSLL